MSQSWVINDKDFVITICRFFLFLLAMEISHAYLGDLDYLGQNIGQGSICKFPVCRGRDIFLKCEVN